MILQDYPSAPSNSSAHINTTTSQFLILTSGEFAPEKLLQMYLLTLEEMTSFTSITNLPTVHSQQWKQCNNHDKNRP